MKKTIGNIAIMTVCLIAIGCWIYFRIYNEGKGGNPIAKETPSTKLKEEVTPLTEEKKDNNHLISKNLENNLSIEEVDSKAENTDTIITRSLDETEKTNTTIESQEEEEEKISEEIKILFNKAHIKYILQENETWQEGTVKLKKIMETTGTGYDYNKFKSTRVFFYIKNGTQKLKWNEAYQIYYKKKDPEAGDFFYMERFSY